MLFLAVLAATAPAEAPAWRRPEIVEQARATVRIVSGAWLTAERIPEDALVREVQLVRADGSRATARLVEFP